MKPQGTPGINSVDFVGVSHSFLVEMIQSRHVSNKVFRAALITVIEKHGATHNQRSLLNETMKVALEMINNGPQFKPEIETLDSR